MMHESIDNNELAKVSFAKVEEGGFSETPYLVRVALFSLDPFLGLIVLSGLLGNLYNLHRLFKRSNKRHHTVTHYLTCLAISDILMLTVKGVEMLVSFVGLPLPSVWGYTQMQMFLAYVTCFFSSWLVVGITAERALVVRRPFLARRITKVHARVMILMIAAIALVWNAWVLFAFRCDKKTILDEQKNVTDSYSHANMSATASKDEYDCTMAKEFVGSVFFKMTTIVDFGSRSVFFKMTTIVDFGSRYIQTVSLCVLNGLIIVSLRSASARRKQLRNTETKNGPAVTPMPSRVDLTNSAQTVTRVYSQRSLPTARVASAGSSPSTPRRAPNRMPMSAQSSPTSTPRRAPNRMKISVSTHALPSAHLRIPTNQSVASFASYSNSHRSNTTTVSNYSTYNTFSQSPLHRLPVGKWLTTPRLLVIISLAHIVLNLPRCTLKLVGLLGALPLSGNALQFIEQLTYVLYYTQFAVNFLFYGRLHRRGRGGVTGRGGGEESVAQKTITRGRPL